MASNSAAKRFFAVTTPGLSATRWLAYVLASHRDVFIAHGKHALDAVMHGDFQKEKETANLLSLEHGNDQWDFYADNSLEAVFAHYQQVKPDATVLGCIHSYTIDSLVRAAKDARTLAGMRICNVVRHPVSFIASHYAMVRSAEKFPRLYRQYADNVFPQALRDFPELYLMDCRDFRAFLAFAISCHSVANMIHDRCYPGLATVRMEVLTSQADVLQEVCEKLTGLTYSRDTLESFIRHGAINQHRSAKSGQDPHAIFASWEPWQQDMAHALIPGSALAWLESLGYDVTMLREKPATRSAVNQSRVLNLGDHLRVLDSKHPWLDGLQRTAPSTIQFIESDALVFDQANPDWTAIAAAITTGANAAAADSATPRLLETYQGFNLIGCHGSVFAVAQQLGAIDVPGLVRDRLWALQNDRYLFIGKAIAEARTWINGLQRVIVPDCHGFKLIAHEGKAFAVAHQLGTLDLASLGSGQRQRHQADLQLFVADTEPEVRAWIGPTLLEAGCHGFNLVRLRGKILAVAQNLGDVNLTNMDDATVAQHRRAGKLAVCATDAEARAWIDSRLGLAKVWSKLRGLVANRVR